MSDPLSLLDPSFEMDDLRSRTIVVISDAYPPYAVGGAEISLSLCVNALTLAERKKVVVLVRSDGIRKIQSAFFNSVLVIRVPDSGGFPFNSIAMATINHSRLRRYIGARNHGRYQLLRQFFSPGKKAAVLMARKEARIRPHGGTLNDHLTGEEDFNTRACIALIRQMENFERLVSDNTRSILSGARILASIRPSKQSVAVVRDNRFHCPRPSQSAIVQGKMCKTPCKFECAKVDAPNHADLRKTTLGLTYQYRKDALNAHTKILTTSHQLVRHLVPVIDDSSRLVRVPNGFGSTDAVDKMLFGRAQSPKIRLLIIGMLNENKGQIQFIKKTTNWLKRNRDIEIVLCGRGERISNAISKHIEKSCIKNQVSLLGFRPRNIIYDELAKASLVLAPTVWPEPFGRVPLEAGAAGRVIVAFGVGGLNETVIDGKTGLLIPPGDYGAFTRAIDSLLQEPERRLKMERAARAHVRKNYNLDATAMQFAETVFRDTSVLR